MNNIEYKFPYWGPFLMDVQIGDETISLLLEKGKENQKKHLDARKNLAAVINKAYYFEEVEWFYSIFDPYVNGYIEGASNYMPGAFKKPPITWELGGLWINYQKAYEYNPPHNHDEDISFVIYLQVPDEIVKENEETKDKHNNSGPGMINFDYGNEMPFSISRFNMMPKVGQAFIFPAWLLHHVFAFKSDVERISVSGNITFKYDKI